MKVFENYSLLPHNTFGIDAKCWQFVEIETATEAAEKLPFVAKTTRPLMVIGGGSNLLLTKDYDGIIVHSAIKGIKVEPSVPGGSVAEPSVLSDSIAEPHILLTAGSGETFDDVVATAVSLGYYGLENLSIIPGDVGASAVQNIGAYGVEIKDVLYSIDAVEIKTGKKVTIKNEDCHYAYRYSRFKGKKDAADTHEEDWRGRYFITHVTYKLSTVFEPHLDYGGIRKALAERGIEEPTAQDVRNTIIEIRNAKLPDPKVLGNGGSFFMNPIVSKAKFENLLQGYPQMPHYIIKEAPSVLNDSIVEPKYKIPAGWLIEQCGWKGKALGNAAVHDKQALVLVNLGNAKGDEILTLCETVRADVLNKFGIDIHPEVNII